MTTVPKVLECGVTLEVYEMIGPAIEYNIAPPKFKTGTAFLNWLNSLRIS